jgi:uncharacterized membrane protein YfcA
MGWLILEGLIIGGLLGLTGAGGGILAVPALMLSQGLTVAQAAPIGLLAVTLSAMVGMLEGLFKKIVRYRAALWIALMSIPAAHLGVVLTAYIPSIGLTLLFSSIMLIVAYRILFNKVTDYVDPPCKINPSTGRLIWNGKTAFLLTVIGGIAGLLTGLLGVGGGFVIVPALRHVTNLDLRSIVATSLMIIFLIGGVSIAIHLLDGFHYPVSLSLTFVCACMVGMLIGRSLMHRLDSRHVQKIFAVTIIGVAVYLVWSALIT